MTNAPALPKSCLAKSEELAAELTELCAYLNAATYRFLTLIHEFDKSHGWARLGMASCAHWLNFKCGISMHAAREKVRVANALAEFPKMSRRFERGELSYSKVRAMTRVATRENEDYLLMIAKHGTAHHVDKLVSLYRGCKRRQENEKANKAHQNRELNCRYDTDGSLIIHGRIPAEQGALIMKALQRAMARNDQRNPNDAADVPAGTSEREPFRAQRADALSELAEIYLAADDTLTSTADRYQVVVHVSPNTLIDPTAAGAACEVQTANPISRELSHIDNGANVPAGTSRRIACDCSIVKLTEDEQGEPLSIGRKSRTIPPAMRRALRARDKGCRFPGCTNTQFIDGHHIQHWADGGETSMDNLVQLCRKHHRLVHEGGFGCERNAEGRLVFTDEQGNSLAESFKLPSINLGQNPIGWIQSRITPEKIDSITCVPHTTAGEHMDWHLAVGHLYALETPDQPVH